MAALPKLPTFGQFLNMGVVVLLVLMVLHFVPALKFWERFPALGAPKR